MTTFDNQRYGFNEIHVELNAGLKYLINEHPPDMRNPLAYCQMIKEHLLDMVTPSIYTGFQREVMLEMSVHYFPKDDTREFDGWGCLMIVKEADGYSHITNVPGYCWNTSKGYEK